jgi:hypothetical protein
VYVIDKRETGYKEYHSNAMAVLDSIKKAGKE